MRTKATANVTSTGRRIVQVDPPRNARKQGNNKPDEKKSVILLNVLVSKLELVPTQPIYFKNNS